MKDSTTNPISTSKVPSHAAYHIRESKKGQKAFWTRIGTAWQHADGKGFNIQVDTLPLDGQIGLRILSDRVE